MDQNQQVYIVPLVRLDKIKDIGVYFDTRLDFKDHMHEKINKAYMMLGLINRNFKHDYSHPCSIIQEAQLMLTTGSTRLAVSRGQQTWYHSTCYI